MKKLLYELEQNKERVQEIIGAFVVGVCFAVIISYVIFYVLI